MIHFLCQVLGKGVLPKQPVIVKARFFSRRAEEKIKVSPPPPLPVLWIRFTLMRIRIRFI
jgi:hypothetical protein